MVQILVETLAGVMVIIMLSRISERADGAPPKRSGAAVVECSAVTS